MKKALFVQMGEIADCIIATSLLKTYSNDGFEIDCVTNENGCQLFKFCQNSNVHLLSDFKPSCKYHSAVNVSAGVLGSSLMECIEAENKFGFGRNQNDLKFYNEGAEKYYEAIYLRHLTQSSYFQLLYSLAGRTWRGEGYNIGYYPRNRCRKTLTGVAVRNSELKKLIHNSLKLEKSRLWDIPFKQNILKLYDEVNRCKRIVTDDIAVLHVACSLRKKVEYVATTATPYRIEMFGSGNIHLYNTLEDYGSQYAAKECI